MREGGVAARGSDEGRESGTCMWLVGGCASGELWICEERRNVRKIN